jgi:signal transduction histidine kinase/ActR/RegA family two-component response regulator
VTLTMKRRSRAPRTPSPAAPHRTRNPPPLSTSYRALSELYEAGGARSTSAVLLALVAMRASSTALAAFRGGACLARNERWLRTAVERGAPWRPIGCDDAGARDSAPTPTLEALALTRAAELEASSETVLCERAERVDGGATVELRLERARVGQRPAVLASIVDVTDRTRAERDLERAREAVEVQERLRAVGELASGLAHDLNNTLHALRLRLSRLAGCVSECHDHREDLRAVERIASDVTARVRRLEDVARLRRDVPDQRVELEALIEESAELARRATGEQGAAQRPVGVEVSLSWLPPVVADRAELGHVFLSLLRNAREAMPGGGRIWVTGRAASDGAVEVTVADEGGGIPPENLERIFHPFFTTKGRRGTGLGLSTAAGVMRRLGGSIRADNRPGGGAAFTLRFPPAPARAVEDARPAPTPATRAHGGHRVLVVDDDPDNLEAMRLVLGHRGHRVETTESGLDAIGRIEAGERYDTVFCDLALGDSNGWEVATRIAAAAPGTRIVLVTGWAQEIPPDDPRRRHVLRVLPKPLDVDELVRVLRDDPEPGEPHGEGGAGEPSATRVVRASPSADVPPPGA